MPVLGQPVLYRDDSTLYPATVFGLNADGTFELSVQKRSSAGAACLEMVTAAPTDIVPIETSEALAPLLPSVLKKSKKDEEK